MSKPIVIWFEQLTGSGVCEVPALFDQHFSVRSATSEQNLESLLGEVDVAAVFFDFDFPDRHRLAVFAKTKRLYPSIPLVILSVQHSESLSTWAFRAGALDFLVKPANQGEIEGCVRRILAICDVQRSQGKRTTNAAMSPIPTEVPHGAHTTRSRLAPAVCYVQQHYNEHIFSDVMARLCDMSPSSFSHAFSKTYGLTFQEFLLRYRVRRACQQLRSPLRQQISDVAYSVGFSDPSYFSRVFKRYIGIAPSEFATADGSKQADFVTNESSDDPLSSSGIIRQLKTAFPADSA